MKEIIAGFSIALIIFLAILGVNVVPIIFFLLAIGGLYFFMQSQGQMQIKNVGAGMDTASILQFEEIGGQDTAINELKEALQFLVNFKEISLLGIRPLKGVLLVGPPGTGKTLMARAAANFTSSAFVATSGSEFIEMYAGVGAKRIRQLFSDARKKAQNRKNRSAIIFIDELEILGARRGSHSSHMEYDQTLNQLLVEMDGISQDEEPRILLIGATNRADMLDPALMRPGRFDRQVQVGMPDKAGRQKILDIHTRNKPLDEDVQMDEIAKATFGFSGAHLESLANEAAILAMRENSSTITQRHFTEAIDKVIMGEKLDRKISAIEIERVCVHESGHALVSEIMEPGSVASLTIVPRGRALGFMRKTSPDDQYLYTREELEHQIMVTLAGAVAEEMKFGSRSTGAKNDFEQAWSVAGDIIDSGLSSLGVVNRDDLPGEVFYHECKNILSKLEEETRSFLEKNQNILYRLSDVILQEETINRGQLLEIIGREG